MKRSNFFSFILMILMGSGLVSGCLVSQSPLPRFYLLTTATLDQNRPLSESLPPKPKIELASVKIPRYLDRPQIVTRTTLNELRLAEFDRWAEPLDSNITRVIRENLAVLLNTNSIFSPSDTPVAVDYRIRIRLTRLDGKLNDKAVLVSRWYIYAGGTAKLLLSKESRVVQPVTGGSYQALVKAESMALTSLTEEISSALKRIMR